MADPLEVLREQRFARLWAAVRRRLEDDREARAFRLADFSEGELQALCGLLGEVKPMRNGQMLRLAELDRTLKASAAELGLREVVERVGGRALRDRRAERAATRAARDDLWERAQLRAGRRLSGLLDELRAGGHLTREANRGAHPDALLDKLLELLERLPSDGILLQVLATELTGNAHGLDPDQPLGRLGLRAAAHLCALAEIPSSAVARRRLWAQMGVRCEELSSHVLCLGLRPLGSGPLCQSLNSASCAGEPTRLTLRALRRERLRVDEDQTVFVCENPAVVAEAADRLGTGCAPLVCLEGMPSDAVMALLGQLSESGASLAFHCDFDEAGIRIGNQLHFSQLRTTPWRFDVPDYEAALRESSELWPLSGTVPRAGWSEELAGRMAAEGKAIHEEQVLAGLVADIGA